MVSNPCFLPTLSSVLHLSLLCITVFSCFCDAKLYTNYYRKSCPKMADIIRNQMIDKQINHPTTAAGTVRLFFHDCFVNGCDGSVLISSNSFNKAERDHDINLSLPGDAFDAVIRSKMALELTCPGVVSCSDILAVATRDLITMVGGPYYDVSLGRKDSLVSKASVVDDNLPLPSMPMDKMIELFTSKGFTAQELVVLSGAHTIGFSHCKEFAHRIFNYSKTSAFDPAMDPRLAKGLQSICGNYTKDPTMSAFNDVMTPGKFDNLYYQNSLRGLALLESDKGLAADPRTKPFVELYAANQTAFFTDFANAMVKVSQYGVKTGKDGEVRRKCDIFNNFNTASNALTS